MFKIKKKKKGKLLMVAPGGWQHQDVSAFDTKISEFGRLRKWKRLVELIWSLDK